MQIITKDFCSPDSSKQFVLSGLHAKPDDAVAELDFMPVVYDDIVSKIGLRASISFYFSNRNACIEVSHI